MDVETIIPNPLVYLADTIGAACEYDQSHPGLWHSHDFVICTAPTFAFWSMDTVTLFFRFSDTDLVCDLGRWTPRFLKRLPLEEESSIRHVNGITEGMLGRMLFRGNDAARWLWLYYGLGGGGDALTRDEFDRLWEGFPRFGN